MGVGDFVREVEAMKRPSTPQILTIPLQKRILKLVDAGWTYEQIREALHVTSTSIARVLARRDAYRDGLVDTEFCGQRMYAKNGQYMPTPEEIKQRAELIRLRRPRRREDVQPVEIQEVSLWIPRR
jgi:hypothetical protein